ncbi:hypothetical protein CERSUDRAFT_118701 [Gelatoporia subvermispora B]|uniref:Uncharacterized protein n=1 Tax=Ceriporiopsis subvermispora (strain B) TaxID=914234 RepID=M2R1B7_CERS8|nr:hypothetical protein CERSUDRAFT_118701 [Gelatoporia subvermispora B]
MPAHLSRVRPSIGRTLAPALTVLTLNECEPVRERAVSPTSPRPPGESPSILKAVRALEHDRQRAKRAETRRAREQKARRDGMDKRRAHPARGAQAQRKSVGQKAANASWAGDERAERALALEASDESPILESSAAAPGRIEVELSELVKPGKVHKSKGAADFEVIPTVRQVIVLEDGIALEAELDEPWEHISAEDADDKLESAPSYADIVASSA